MDEQVCYGQRRNKKDSDDLSKMSLLTASSAIIKIGGLRNKNIGFV